MADKHCKTCYCGKEIPAEGTILTGKAHDVQQKKLHNERRKAELQAELDELNASDTKKGDK